MNESLSSADAVAPVVEMDGASLRLDGSTILSNVTLRIRRGERWAILGANGSGKTSLVRLMSGFARPSSGTVRLLGATIGRVDLRRLRASIGWVHADLAARIPRYMTVLELVAAGAEGALVYFDQLDDQLAEAATARLTTIGAAHLAERRFETLSTGERQRVLIARALHAEPRLLLLDEPTLGLDPRAREAFLADLERSVTAQRQLTSVLVTHDIGDVTRDYDGVLLIDTGRIVAAGPLETTLTEANLELIYGAGVKLISSARRYSVHFH